MTCVVTGSGGLVGSEAVKYFSKYFDEVIGIDNNQREAFFGASVQSQIKSNIINIDNYQHLETDIRELDFLPFNTKLIVHCAAQPSHDWATNNVIDDFTINAFATVKLMELVRRFCPEAVVIYVSTNKVYGDYPNHLNYVEEDKRYIPSLLNTFNLTYGFNEKTPIDNVKHSFFGCSKLSADLYVQEYGKYFGIKTGVFRCGCITGENHAGAKLHGFLSYLVKCAKEDIPYTVIGFSGKQVRDQIHAYDLCTSFHEFYKNPKEGEVYNMGGGTHSNCSVLEAIEMVEEYLGKKMQISFEDTPRIGDHKWWVTDVNKFRKDYPNWVYKYNIQSILKEMCNA